MNLTWTRSSIPAHIGTGKITTYSTVLHGGTEVEIRSIEGTFFFRFDGDANSGSWADSLKEAKATIQRLNDRRVAACLEPANCPNEAGMPCNECYGARV